MLNKKYLVATGCSFTDGHLLQEAGSWATYFSKKNNLECINLGVGGAGNEFLTSNLIQYATVNKDISENAIFGIQLSECLRTLVCLDFPDVNGFPKYWHITPAQFIRENGFNGWDLSSFHTKFIYDNKFALAPFYMNVTNSVLISINAIISLVDFFNKNNYPFFIFDGITKVIPEKVNDKWQLINPNQNNDCWDVDVIEEQSPDWIFYKKEARPVIHKSIIDYINSIPNYISKDKTLKIYLENLGQEKYKNPNFFFEGNQGHPNSDGCKEWVEYIQYSIQKLFGVYE